MISEDQQSKALSWAAYHSNLVQELDVLPCISTLLPLFEDQAKSPAMIKHSMDIISTATNYLNPGQIPIMTVDLPLYALAKQIQ